MKRLEYCPNANIKLRFWSERRKVVPRIILSSVIFSALISSNYAAITEPVSVALPNAEYISYQEDELEREVEALRRTPRGILVAAGAIGRTNAGGGGASGGLPKFTYTGAYTLLDDGDKNWRIRFLTSGTLTFLRAVGSIDVFLVGGGAGGNWAQTNNGPTCGGSGGGGGYTKTVPGVVPEKGRAYPITIGAGGAPSSFSTTSGEGGQSAAFGESVVGGKGAYNQVGGDGGSGGGNGWGAPQYGGSDGSDGIGQTNPGLRGGYGQGTTTREFGEAGGDLYAGGGGGRNAYGGEGGGGYNDTSGYDGLANTGGGGCGCYGTSAGVGGSGIVVIRNHREAV